MVIRRPLAVPVVVLLIIGGVFAMRLASAQTYQPPGGGDSAGSSAEQPYAFRMVADIPLTGGTSRFDYQSFDQQAHRLYIAHLGASLVTVFDAETGTVVGDVGGVKGVHGVIAVPDLGRVFATATGANQLAVIDPQSLSVIATAPGGDYPDGLAYDPDVGKVYISDEHGGTDTVVDVQTNRPVATVQLGGEAGNTQFDPASHQIFVAVHKVNQLVAIDPTTDRVAGRYDMPGCDDPHGLYINPERRTAFVACEGNAKLLVVDMQTMQVAAEYGVGKTPDVLAFDPALGQLYVAAESGPLTAFIQDDSSVRQLAQADVGPNAHSVAVNPDSHHIYLPLSNVGGRPVLREMALEPQGGG